MRVFCRLFLPTLLAILSPAGLLRAGPGVEQQASPTQANVGDEITLTYTIAQSSLGNFEFPVVDGLQAARQGTSSSFSLINGSVSMSTTLSIIVIPQRPGDIVIPGFAIGSGLKTDPVYLHVADQNGGSAVTSPTAAMPAPASAPPGTRTGPVVIPPNAPAAPATATLGNGNTSISVPLDSDGQPKPVFVIVTPETTNGYVGQSIPLRIETYIRLEANAPQNSLPTLKGGDFLMNNLSLRPNEDEVDILERGYVRDTWVTAISAPKSGDFPLQMERDTYWSPGGNSGFPGFFGSFFHNQGDLRHENIQSNQVTLHVRPLPDEGRPTGFGGAIGQFKATGSSAPDAVQVGEPVTLHFEITGSGNFDYVKIPYLPDDPAWRTYAPTSHTRYTDEPHLNAIKVFEQALIPARNGAVPLPQASFSYFDPADEKYKTIAIPLPTVQVTGTLAAAPPPPPGVSSGSATSLSAPPAFAPNRLEAGRTSRTVEPLYRLPSFWMTQGVLGLLLGFSTLFSSWREGRAGRGIDLQAERARMLTRDESAMAQAAEAGDAGLFFAAARRVVLGGVGQKWNVAPETLSLESIRQHDAGMATRIEPLLTQADEVHYSGGTGAPSDLAAWNTYVLDLVRTL